MTSGLGKVMRERTIKENILGEVRKERDRQDAKWGEQNHSPFVWLAILGEEVGEVNKAALESVVFRPQDRDAENQWLLQKLEDYREELVQVAAVACAMIESFDRMKWIKEGIR